MQSNRNELESKVRQSMFNMFKNNLEDHQLQALRNGLTAAQFDLVISKIADALPVAFDNYIAGAAAMLSDESVLNLKQAIIRQITETTFDRIKSEMMLMSAQAVKNRKHYDLMSTFKDWASGKLVSPSKLTIDECVRSGLYSASYLADPITHDPTLVKDVYLNLEKKGNEIYDRLASNGDFPKIDAGKEDLLDRPDIKQEILNKTARAIYVLSVPYQDSLSFSQNREVMDSAAQMLIAYILQEIGDKAILFQDPETIETKVNQVIADNFDYMREFLDFHVEMTNTFQNSSSPNAEQRNSREKVSEMLNTMGELTYTASDVIANSPDLHGKIQHLKTATELAHISAGGGTGLAVTSGISLLSIPAEYAIAKMRGEKPPEMTKEKAWKATTKTVGFGLAITALCVPHIAVTVAVVGASLGAVTAIVGAAKHFRDKKKLMKLIPEIQERIPNIEKRIETVMNDLRSLTSISEQINGGSLFTKEQIKAFRNEVARVKGHLDQQMHLLQSDLETLNKAIVTLKNEFSSQATVGVATSVVTGATYLAGSAMEFVPILNVAGNALMVASDVCSLTYSASAQLSASSRNSARAENASVSNNTNTLFSNPANDRSIRQAANDKNIVDAMDKQPQERSGPKTRSTR